VVRARRHERAGRPRFRVDPQERRGLATRFFGPNRTRDVDTLRTLLAADVQLVSDTGRNAPAPPQPTVGVQHAAHERASVPPQLGRVALTLQPQQINGEPGALARDRHGHLVQAITLDTADGRIHTIRSVSNPDKLTHLGPVADPWQLARDYREARQQHR